MAIKPKACTENLITIHLFLQKANKPTPPQHALGKFQGLSFYLLYSLITPRTQGPAQGEIIVLLSNDSSPTLLEPAGLCISHSLFKFT